jgi:hypothetical protein
MPTLYQPPPKPIFPRRVLKGLLLALLLAGVGGYLYQRQPGWFTNAATGLLGLFGYEMATVEVSTNPLRAEILLDGERMTSLPLHVRRDGSTHRVTVLSSGFETTEVTFLADGDRKLFLTLKPDRHR